MDFSVHAVLTLTRKTFLALTSRALSVSSVLALFFRPLGSNESVSRELTLAVGVVFAFAGDSSSPDLRFDLLGGIVAFNCGAM